MTVFCFLFERYIPLDVGVFIDGCTPFVDLPVRVVLGHATEVVMCRIDVEKNPDLYL